jgi:hypothetical protein
MACTTSLRGRAPTLWCCWARGSIRAAGAGWCCCHPHACPMAAIGGWGPPRPLRRRPRGSLIYWSIGHMTPSSRFRSWSSTSPTSRMGRYRWHRRAYAELARLIARGRDYAAFTPDRYGFATQLRIVPLFDRGVKRIHVDMNDLAPACRTRHGLMSALQLVDWYSVVTAFSEIIMGVKATGVPGLSSRGG